MNDLEKSGKYDCWN